MCIEMQCVGIKHLVGEILMRGLGRVDVVLVALVILTVEISQTFLEYQKL